MSTGFSNFFLEKKAMIYISVVIIYRCFVKSSHRTKHSHNYFWVVIMHSVSLILSEVFIDFYVHKEYAVD